ncbi:hypothetical protein E2542_SST29939 [Spatholobus suberectus]|nr:hypothetical protein E2542_SST29939 [Spatholobus suberectus]
MKNMERGNPLESEGAKEPPLTGDGELGATINHQTMDLIYLDRKRGFRSEWGLRLRRRSPRWRVFRQTKRRGRRRNKLWWR